MPQSRRQISNWELKVLHRTLLLLFLLAILQQTLHSSCLSDRNTDWKSVRLHDKWLDAGTQRGLNTRKDPMASVNLLTFDQCVPCFTAVTPAVEKLWWLFNHKMERFIKGLNKKDGGINKWWNLPLVGKEGKPEPLCFQLVHGAPTCTTQCQRVGLLSHGSVLSQ